MSSGASETIHATCVALDGAGVLLLGPSGCGKSDLALRLLSLGGSGDGGPRLVSDDQVSLTRVSGRLLASPPDTIAGRLEVRGVGVVTVPYFANIGLALAIELVSPYEVRRLPDRDASRFVLLDVALPKFRLAPFEASAPAKIQAAARAIAQGTFAEDIVEGGSVT